MKQSANKEVAQIITDSGFMGDYKNLLENTPTFNHQYIRTVLKNCPHITGFKIDDKGVINNQKIKSYIDTVLEDLINPNNMTTNYIRVNTSHMNLQFKQILKNQNASKFYLLLSLYTALFEYTSKIIKKRANEDTFSIILNHLVVAGLSLFQGISILHTSGLFYSLIPQLRTLYENSVIFLFINKYRNLAEPYFDHSEATKISLLETMSEKRPLDDKLLLRKNELIEKYGGEDFFKPYGWTKAVIPLGKKRKLQTLAEDILQNEHSTPYYKHLSAFIHSNAFSVNSFPRIDDVYIKPFITLTLFLKNNVMCSYMAIDEIPPLHKICIANLLDTVTKILFMPEVLQTADKKGVL